VRRVNRAALLADETPGMPFAPTPAPEGEAASWDCSAGMENPTTDDVGRAFFTGPEGDDEDEVEGESEDLSKEAHDFLTGGVAGAGAGVEVVGAASGTAAGVVAVVVDVDVVSAETVGSVPDVVVTVVVLVAPSFSLPAATTDIDVLLLAGDPGRVGVSVAAVAEDEGTVDVV